MKRLHIPEPVKLIINSIEIGQRVHQARKEAHLSRDELAERLNVSTLFLGYIECGQKGMSLTTLKKMCSVLGVFADFLLFGDTDNPSKANINLILNNLDEKYLPIAEQHLKDFVSCINRISEMSQTDENQ